MRGTAIVLWLLLGCFGGTLKALAVSEYAPLYRFFLFLPAQFASAWSGLAYTEEAGIYRFPGFVLDYSCAGINFCILCLVTAAFASTGSARKILNSAMIAVVISVSAWAMTQLANLIRIALSLKLLPLSTGRPWLHEAIGSIVFLFFLIVFYLLYKGIIHARTRPAH